MPKAVIDVGSNSLLLVVAEGDSVTTETSTVTALGEGTKATALLGKQGITATLAALKTAFETARKYDAEPKAFGTMALRIAANTADFLQRAYEQGTPIEIISGDLEAELGLASVTEDSLFASEKRLTIIDVGGHSTEIATAENGKELFRHSFPVGTLSLRSETLSNESPTPNDLLKASAEIDDILGQRFLPGQTGTVVALGASGTNLITIRDHILEWDPALVHGAYLDFEYISKFVGSASRLTDAGRAALPGIEKGRERTIHIGALVLERSLQMLHALGCRVSVRGWRYAMLSRI